MPAIDPPQLANLVRETRQRLNLSQTKLAAKLEVSFQSINCWENGRTKSLPIALDLSQKSNLAPLTPPFDRTFGEDFGVSAQSNAQSSRSGHRQLWGESNSKSPRIGDALSLPKGGFRGRLRIYARGLLKQIEYLLHKMGEVGQDLLVKYFSE